jgi:hypothetical protein
MYPAVGTALDGTEGVSEIKDGGIALAKANVDRLGHLAWESGMGWSAILPADLVDKRLHCGEVLLDMAARRRGKGNVSRVDVWQL